MHNTKYITYLLSMSFLVLVGMNRILASTFSAIGPAASQQDGVLGTDEIPYLSIPASSRSAMMVDGLYSERMGD